MLGLWKSVPLDHALLLSNGIMSCARSFVKYFFVKAAVSVLSLDVFIWFVHPVLAGLRHSINDFHKVSVETYVYHFAESIIPDAGVML